MPERYTNEWWHIQVPPLVFPSDDLVEAMAQAIVQVHRRQLKDTGGFTVERADDIGSVSSVVDSTFLPVFGQSPKERFEDLFRQVAHLTFHLAKKSLFRRRQQAHRNGHIFGHPENGKNRFGHR